MVPPRRSFVSSAISPSRLLQMWHLKRYGSTDAMVCTDRTQRQVALLLAGCASNVKMAILSSYRLSSAHALRCWAPFLRRGQRGPETGAVERSWRRLRRANPVPLCLPLLPTTLLVYLPTTPLLLSPCTLLRSPCRAGLTTRQTLSRLRVWLLRATVTQSLARQSRRTRMTPVPRSCRLARQSQHLKLSNSR